MKVKFANRIYEVLFTKELSGLTMYAVEDKPNHIDWLINVEVVDAEKKEPKKIEQKPTKNIVEIWKDMRVEVYQQASGNRHEPNYSDDTTKMFSLNDIDEIIEKMSEQKPTDNDMKEALRTEYEKGRADAFAEMQVAWSEDDKAMLKETLALIETVEDINKAEDGFLSVKMWLKSLKRRIGG